MKIDQNIKKNINTKVGDQDHQIDIIKRDTTGTEVRITIKMIATDTTTGEEEVDPADQIILIVGGINTVMNHITEGEPPTIDIDTGVRIGIKMTEKKSIHPIKIIITLA